MLAILACTAALGFSALRPAVAPDSLPSMRRVSPPLQACATGPSPREAVLDTCDNPMTPVALDGQSTTLPWPPAATMLGAAAAAVFLHPSSAQAMTTIVPAASSFADNAFVQSLSLIFVSELGDKTFFIAALLAARASKLLTFAGCAGALAFMTVLSVAIGQIFHSVPPSLTRGLPIDDYVAIASFLYFGIKSLVDALTVEEDGAGIAEEREDAEKTLSESGIDVKGGWPRVIEASTLTLAAEVGDRSQLATIALGAASNPFGVALGGTVGHCIATGMAVLGGSFISK